MKRIVPAIIVASVGLTLVADSTGTLKGRVLDTKGNPVPMSTVVVSRIGLNWTKTLNTREDGKFFQVGFTPGDYEITASCQGFVETKVQEHIGLGIQEKDIILMTPEEAARSGKASAPVDASASAESMGLEAFNRAVGYYNDKNFTEAIPLFESASNNLSESISKTTDPAVKTELEKKLVTVRRPYAFSLMEVGKAEEAKRTDSFAKAEPMLVKAIEINPKDQNAIVYMLDIATAKKDTEGMKKYQAALDTILGPRPELAYNQGVELYNAGKLAEAKPFFLKSLGVKADFADAYYLLAMCEFSENNLKGTKANLQKYIELAPTGKHAAEVKAMLADPSLKNVK